jgi:glutamate-ammonia-ligase adenylyltransferase
MSFAPAKRLTSRPAFDAPLPPFAVIAMGKLGGQELNYASDIDLIFVHGDDAPAAYCLGLAQRLVSALSEATPDGFVFRVDMRLRPEGRFGPLARSLASCAAYYESWGEAWERQALLKARPIAGDGALGAAFVRTVQPFVWGRIGTPGGARAFLEDLRENKRRIEAKMRAAGTWRTSVKEGFGGIRDVEWATQMWQLALGPAHPGLRPLRGTEAALAGLAEIGALSSTDRATLTDAYWFLRAVEHRLQIRDELPVRDLPRDERERARLAGRLNFADLAAFDAHYRDVTETVHALSTRLIDDLFRPRRASSVVVPTAAMATGDDIGDNIKDDFAALLLAAGGVGGAGATDPRAQAAVRARLTERLAAMGFVEPGRALDLLLIPAVGTPQGAPTPGARRRFLAIADDLVTACARTPDPDAALLGLENLAQVAPSREALYAALVPDEEDPGGNRNTNPDAAVPHPPFPNWRGRRRSCRGCVCWRPARRR